MAKIKILHSESKDYCQSARDILDSFADVDYMNIGRREIVQNIERYDALIVRLRNAVDQGIIRKGKSLKAIASATTAVNHIDESAARNRDITIISLKGETQILKSVYSTAEYTFGLILALLRRIPAAQNDVFKGRWRNESFRGHELYGKTLGIIGLGRLGQMVAGIAQGFGMSVLAYDIDRKKSFNGVQCIPLTRLLKTSDIVSLHIPLNKQTQQFMNLSRLKTMKKGSWLINTSRGAVVDEKVLLRLLENGHLAGAALDVLAGEEKRDFKVSLHPLVRYAKHHDNVIMTPHIGGAALEAIAKTDIFIAQQLKRFFTNGT